jgi:hypothetical protein
MPLTRIQSINKPKMTFNGKIVISLCSILGKLLLDQFEYASNSIHYEENFFDRKRKEDAIKAKQIKEAE